MTKLNSFRKTERKQLKKIKNEKILFYQTEDTDENFEIGKSSKSRIPSKQQYKRIKNKHFIQKFTTKSPLEIKVSNIEIKSKPIHELITHDQVTKLRRLSELSDETSSGRPQSSLSFHIQPDWADFEDTEHIQFVSEMDVDLSKVFKLFDDKEISDFGVFDDLCLPYEVSENNLSSWAEDLSTHRFDHAISTACFIEGTIRTNYTTIFTMDFKPMIWTNSLGDATSLLIFCESNKCLFQDLMTKEYSISMQNNCLKWTELGTKCSLIKSCLEKIVNFNEGKFNLDTALSVLYEQCISIIEHGLVFPDPLVVRIIEGMKKILQNLKNQYNRINIILEDLLDLPDKCPMALLDKVNQDINILEVGESSDNQMKSIITSVGKYLGKEHNWIQEPVLNFSF